MRVGLLGGIFNPPHHGHLALARAAHGQLGLYEVVLIPAARPPHREVDADPGPEVRLALSVLLAAQEPWLSVSRAELDRDGPSWTVETLRALREERPGDELVLLLGGDQAAALPGWREPEEVLSLATVAACARGEFDRARVREALTGLAGGERLEFFDLDPVPVSSTEVRRRVAAGERLDGIVPAPIVEALSERGLYQAAVTG